MRLFLTLGCREGGGEGGRGDKDAHFSLPWRARLSCCAIKLKLCSRSASLLTYFIRMRSSRFRNSIAAADSFFRFVLFFPARALSYNNFFSLILCEKSPPSCRLEGEGSSMRYAGGGENKGAPKSAYGVFFCVGEEKGERPRVRHREREREK